ncbi:MAG: exodeoxyribonuclease VII large subunit, partial [Actinomycetota bacterium]
MAETLTVRELCTAVSAVVAEGLPDEVWVKGAISGLKRSANGHVYFDLIDPTDDVGAATGELLPVALFAANKHRVNSILRKSGAVRMTDGLEIRIRGRVAFYPAQSRIQLIMSLIDPAYTTGQLAVARQALLDQLRAEGVLGRNATRAFPVLPLRVGLVTSDQSAAFADFEHELAASGYAFSILL